jgi:peptidyl-prolyl cis-trans isomerase D
LRTLIFRVPAGFFRTGAPNQHQVGDKGMLDLMRKHAKNWLMKVILGIIIIVFVFYFGAAGIDERSQRIAMIDGKPIVHADFQREYQNMLEMYRQRFGPALTEEMIRGMGLKQQAFDNLINQEVILKKAADMKIQVSEEDVRAMILAYPAFQRNGGFDERIYQDTLRTNRMAPEDFERVQRRLLLTLRVEDLIHGGVTVSDQEVREIYRMQTEKIGIEFVQLSPQAWLAGIKPTAGALEAYLKANEGRFRVPEQVRVRYLAFLGENYAPSVKVSEDEVADAYQRRKAEWTEGDKVQPLKAVRDKIIKDIQQIRGQFAAADQAKKAHDTIYQNENFDAYAAENKLTIGTTGLFGIANPPPEFTGVADLGRIASRLEKNEISRVLQGEKGYYLIQLVEKKAASLPALKEIEAEVAARYREEEAGKLAKQEAEEMLARLKKGGQLAAEAGKKGLKVLETGLFQPGGEIPKLGHSPELTETLFLLSEKKPYPETPFPIGGNYVIVRFKQRGPADDTRFAEQKEAITDYLLRSKKTEVVKAWIEGSKAALIKEGRLEISRDVKDL